MAHSSRGLGHLPLKEEITGSNPVCATKEVHKAGQVVPPFLLVPRKFWDSLLASLFKFPTDVRVLNNSPCIGHQVGKLLTFGSKTGFNLRAPLAVSSKGLLASGLEHGIHVFC